MQDESFVDKVALKLFAISREPTGKLSSLVEAAGLDKYKAFIDVDLSNQDLSGDPNLYGFNFRNANLKGVDFSNSTLTNVDFSYADLEGVKFINSKLQNVNFNSALLTHSQIYGSYFLNSNLKNAKLNSASINSSTFENVTINDQTEFNSVETSELEVKNSPELSVEVEMRMAVKKTSKTDRNRIEKVNFGKVIELFPFDFESASLIRNNISSEIGRKSWTIQRKSGKSNQYMETLDELVSIEMVSIPDGKFQMALPSDGEGYEPKDGPQHEVMLESFFIGKYPITQAQWRVVASYPKIKLPLNPSPAKFKGENRPIERVSWNDAIEFCARLSAQTEREYRLPSEAEWEYACRAGTTTPFHFGETISTDLANYKGFFRSDGTFREFCGETTPVGSYGVANEFGLFDMHGNVWEWCRDRWSNYMEALQQQIYESENSDRVLRGGSWYYGASLCRSACRVRDRQDYCNANYGFRIVCQPVAGFCPE